jgi:hypothetical protein
MTDTNPRLTVRVPFLYASSVFISYLLAKAWFEASNPNDTPQPVYVTAWRR